jgi:hypothetical protein
MRRLGRIGIFSESVHKFLVNLKRNQPDAFCAVDSGIIERHLTANALSCFSRVKTSDSRKTLSQVAGDLFGLIRQFKGCAEAGAIYSYKLIAGEIDFIGKKTIADFLRDHQYLPSHLFEWMRAYECLERRFTDLPRKVQFPESTGPAAPGS